MNGGSHRRIPGASWWVAAACAAPLALSHDIGGAIGLVALAPLMLVARRWDQPFAHGFLCGFVEVGATMIAAGAYSPMVPLVLALQGGLARGALAWAVRRGVGPWLPVAVLVVGQGLRASSVLTLPLSTGHDLATTPWLAWPAAFGGGALLTALCGLVAYALSHRNGARRALTVVAILVVAAGLHELLRPSAAAEVRLEASVIQGGVPAWAYNSASIDPPLAAAIAERYLARAEAEPKDRLLILPETAVRENYGHGPATARFAALHQRGNGLIVGVPRRVDGYLRNQALVWPAQAEQPVFQDKQMLVPVVEREFEGLDGAPLTLPGGGRLMICIESVYPPMASGVDLRWLLVITNDAGVGRSTPRRAFERESRLRAIETGLSLVRAGQDGLTYALDPRGMILRHLPRYGAGTLRVDALPGPRATLRGAAGDWFWWLCLGVVAVTVRRREIPSSRGREQP